MGYFFKTITKVIEYKNQLFRNATHIMLCVPFKRKNVSITNTGIYEQLNRNDIGCIVC